MSGAKQQGRGAHFYPRRRRAHTYILREEKPTVFIEKVLKRLYPSVASQQLQSTTETSASKSELEPTQVQPSADDENKNQPRKKVYTVSLPPDGYVPCSLEFTDNRKSEKSDSPDDTEEENPQEPSKRRIKKRKPKNILQHPHNVHVEQTKFEENESHLQEKLQPQHTDGPQISKNKKRKLKKKQQKERKRAAGLLTKATGISFTYQPESNSEGEDFKDTNEKADGILDFLQATQEIYFSDSNSKSSGSTACWETIQEILKHLEFHRISSEDIILLHQMKTLVLLQDAERLKGALELFQEECMMPSDHAKEIATLFHYWITDILPIRSRCPSANS
ncbi:glutamate-rich protein 1 isoform X1 [Monodelphis domestica]|uniref:glutamate-rich protein 1 isoform X1 n=1 Tax=Monodelphis domestica TaxID=13616 RepID=UPI0024E1FDE5|nr:glutamate-rich protein 1 isoform X1 [Monodelphis domestica]